MEREPAERFADPDRVRAHLARQRLVQPEDIAGIRLPVAAMIDIWRRCERALRTAASAHRANPGPLRSTASHGLAVGDRLILSAMVDLLQPRRVVVSGSAAAVACVFESAARALIATPHVTCIDCRRDALGAAVTPAELAGIHVLETPLQSTPVSAFTGLGQDDILFLETSHLLTTGSDVHHVLFSVLPSLKPGVVVQFLGVAYPFEYPDGWIFDRDSPCNEAYALRAFLMHNPAYSILFWNSLFEMLCRDLIAPVCPDFLIDPGSSIWLRKSLA